MDLHSGTPLWPLRDGLLSTYPKLDTDTVTDVAVVGAGITGALAALALARRGVNVVLVDRHDVASGSSAATTGLLLYETDSSLRQLTTAFGREHAERVYRLGLDAIDDLERLTNECGDRSGFARRPSLYLASHPDDVPGLSDEFARRAAAGLAVEFLTRETVRAEYGFDRPAAIRSEGNAEVNCYRLTHRLLALAARHGVRIHDRTAVTRWRRRRGRWELTTPAGTIAADQVVVATGYDVPAMFRRPKSRLQTTWVFASEPLATFDGWPGRAIMWDTARPYTYLRSTDDGRLLLGGEDEPRPELHTRARLMRTKTARLLARARALFPRMAIDVAYAWGGTFATTDDGLPYIGVHPARPGLWFALGYGGNGITFSVIASRIIADGCLGVPNPDAAIFGFERDALQR